MLEQFYGDILPEAGYYCLTLLPSGRHLWAESIEELVQLTQAHEGETGVYFGTAAFNSVANRKQSNVLALKALRLDIDAGAKKFEKDPDGTYSTQREALTALVKFCKSEQLAPTYIVSSGEGLHVYFCLSEALAPERWVPLAEGLARLTVAKGLKVDPSVTTDTARILRPLGGLHGNGKAVACLKRSSIFYRPEDLAPKLAPAAARTFSASDLAINDDLSLGYDGPPSSAFKIAQHCGALNEVAVSKGDVPEPHWRAMIGLVKRTVEGIDVAHEWSTGYDGYDFNATERKFNNWNTGPTTCSEFSKHSDACKTCQYAGKVKSPISLGMMTAPEISELPEEKRPAPPAPPAPTGMPWDGQLPPGYSVREVAGHQTLVYAMESEKTTETGEVVPVVVHVPFTYDIFWLGQWSEADDSDDSAQVTLHLWSSGAVKTFMMDQTVVASVPKLLDYLAGKAIHTTTHKKAGQAMQDYTKAHLLRIKGMFQQPKINDRLGLRVMADGTLVCAQGSSLILGDGTIRESMLGPSVRGVADGIFVPVPADPSGVWGPEVWAETIEPLANDHIAFLKRYYSTPGLEKYQLAIMAGLASPLMAFVDSVYNRGSKLPPNGVTVSLYSRETARGKTTAIKSALLAFGDPNALSRDSSATGSTALARIAKMSLHGTVPIGLDEMGDLPVMDVARLISAIANGSGRERADKNGGLVTTNGSWALVALIAANKSAREMASVAQADSDAIQFRMLELNVGDVSEFDNETRAQHNLDWSSVRSRCPGALGAIIHRGICELGTVGVGKLVTECVNRASKEVGAGQSARFQYRILGAILALQMILKRRGLQIFDTKTLVSTFKDAYAAGLEFIEQKLLPTGGLDLLTRALNDLQPHTVVTDKETRITGFSRQYDIPRGGRIPDPVLARHIHTTNTTYLSCVALRDWCHKHGISDVDIVRTAKAENVFKPMTTQGTHIGPFNLLKGMEASVDTRCRVYRVDVARLNLLTDQPITAEDSEESDDPKVVPIRQPEAKAPEVPTGT